jgi:hypothetical protein
VKTIVQYRGWNRWQLSSILVWQHTSINMRKETAVPATANQTLDEGFWHWVQSAGLSLVRDRGVQKKALNNLRVQDPRCNSSANHLRMPVSGVRIERSEGSPPCEVLTF